MSPLVKPLYPAIDCGMLPVTKVNAVLCTELLPGRALLSASAHRHVALEHPDDHRFCIQFLPLAISAPSLVGQAPRHGNNFELIRRVSRSDGRELLVAIGLAPNGDDNYRIVSASLLEREKVENRRLAGRLRPPPP